MDRVLWTLVGIVGGLTVLGFLGRLWWVCDLASHFRVQYGLFLAACALVLLAQKRLRAAAVPATLALVNGALVAPCYWPVAEPPAGPRALRVGVVNLLCLNREPTRALAFFRAARPDFLLLMEVTEHWLRALDELKDDYPHTYALPREDSFGIAVFSRLPLDPVESRQLGSALLPSLLFQVTVDGQTLTVLGTHPLPPVSAANTARRNEHLAQAAQLVRALSGPVLLLGDLNTTPWSSSFRDLVNASGLRDGRRGQGIQATWPVAVPLLRIPIDHCLASPEIAIHALTVGPDLGSDHFPVLVDFSLSR